MFDLDWGVQVKGAAFDIEDWINALTKAAEPWIEIWGGWVVLRSPSFEQCKNPEDVRDAALPLIATLNGAFAVFDGLRPLTFEAVVSRDGDGRERRLIYGASGDANGLKSHLFVEGERTEVPQRESVVQRWLTTTKHSRHLKQSLDYFGRSDYWFDIYKALESLEMHLGGARLTDFDWAPKKEIDLLRRTADGYGKALGEPMRSAVLMNRLDARALLGQLLRAALSQDTL